jgi:hypothetical protein
LAITGALTGVTTGAYSGTQTISNATPLALVNGQTVSVAVTSQTVGAATVTLPNLASVSDTLTLLNLSQTLDKKQLKTYTETTATPTIATNTLTLDLTTGNTFRVALSANVTTLTISNPTASVTQSFTLICDISGAFSITWPASVRWAAASAPTQTATNAKTDIFTFVSTDGGTKWFAFPSGLNFTT